VRRPGEIGQASPILLQESRTPSKFLASDCDEILSEDLSAGQIYKGIPVVNPFEFWL
jgi:hypothetical protein